MAKPQIRWLCFGVIGSMSAFIGCSRQGPPPSKAVPSMVIEKPTELPNFYTIGHYDVSSDPAVELTHTIQRATVENKRILLQVGGDWCSWCKLINQYMEDNLGVNDLLTRHFLVMKVTYPSQHAESFLEQFPRCQAYPHFFVLEKDGTFLHSQGTGELEQAHGYNDALFAEFLTAWISK